MDSGRVLANELHELPFTSSVNMQLDPFARGKFGMLLWSFQDDISLALSAQPKAVISRSEHYVHSLPTLSVTARTA
eukprot:6207098-Amphidinium_carterae.1